jgi:protein N-lysine methyltransferase METTL21D
MCALTYPAYSSVVSTSAGTGLLAIALSPLVRRYTVTDISDLLPLLRKNMALNFDGWPNCLPSTVGSNVFVTDIDWVLLHSTPDTRRSRVFDSEAIDLLLIVDCIYHPSLLPALVDTIHYLSIPDQTVVLVVVELRADDVVREFLQLWLAKPGWEVWRIGDELLRMPYVMWLGSRTQNS